MLSEHAPAPLNLASIDRGRPMKDRLFSLPALLETLGDAAVVADAAGRIVYANAAVTGLLGYPVEELVGAPLERLLPERYRPGHARQMAAFRAQGARRQIGPRPVLTALARDGTERPVTIAVSNVDVGDERYSLALLRDAARFYAHLAQAIEQSETDALTGLANRAPLLRRIEESIVAGQPFGLLFIDLTRFKPFNDLHGHRLGDEVLRIVARRLKGSVRNGDLAVRWAGDEFVLLLGGLGDRDALEMRAEAVAARIGRPFRIGATEAAISANIGGVLHPYCGRTVGELIDAADRAMYRAKQDGRSFVAESCVPDPTAHERDG